MLAVTVTVLFAVVGLLAVTVAVLAVAVAVVAVAALLAVRAAEPLPRCAGWLQQLLLLCGCCSPNLRGWLGLCSRAAVAARIVACSAEGPPRFSCLHARDEHYTLVIPMPHAMHDVACRLLMKAQ